MKTYSFLIALLLELAGAHPRIDSDLDWSEMCRKAGWRPFLIEKVRQS